MTVAVGCLWEAIVASGAQGIRSCLYWGEKRHQVSLHIPWRVLNDQGADIDGPVHVDV